MRPAAVTEDTASKMLVKKFIGLDNGTSTEVKRLAHHPRVKGLKTAAERKNGKYDRFIRLTLDGRFFG